MSHYDAIVIGSGVSGMTTAIILAREGRKVLLLEQHSRPGGLMQHFRRGGLIFPTGVHCLGSLDSGQILWRYFKYLGVLERLNLVPLAPDGFEEYSFPGKRFQIPYGHEAFRRRLHEYFPAEKAAVDRFVSDMRESVAGLALYNLHNTPEWPRMEWEPTALGHYLVQLGCSKELTAVLTAMNPLYGIHPSECPVQTHFLVMDSFLNSSWRIDEYRTPLAEAFVESLLEYGGEVRCGARVVGILSDQGWAKAVRLDSGEIFHADLVVFTGHPKQLIDLCPPGSFRLAFHNRLRDCENTLSAFAVAIRWRDIECPMAQRDVFLYRTWDTGIHYQHKLLATDEKPHMVYCSALPRGADGSFSVVTLTGMMSEELAAFDDSTRGSRSEDYKAAKDLIAERTVAALVGRWPEMESKLSIVDACSPLTFRDYTLTPGGTAYGIKKSVSSFKASRFTAETKIKGLLLAGQSIIQPGIIGALISGVHACTVILGQDYLVEKIAKETR